jgi:hypothetical protein
MTTLIFLSFLLLIYFNYKTPRWHLIIASALFYTLALLTKSTAIIFAAVVPFIFLLGNSTLARKLLGFIGFIVATCVFIYVLFPPIWPDSVGRTPKYVQAIMTGITDIGIEGKKELGSSGKNGNITLDDTLTPKSANFYISSLFMRLSILIGPLLVIALSVYLYLVGKGFLQATFRAIKTIKNKTLPKTFNFSADSWLCFWSMAITLAFFVAFSISAKKTDRYEIVIFPFLFMFIAHLLNKLKLWLSLPILAIYLVIVGTELYANHPYYLAYSNPFLGGIEMRLRALDGDPFGIGGVAAYKIVKQDMSKSGYSGFYTISGSKSIKAISYGGRFSRYPSCVTDYAIVYAFDTKPVNTCTRKYALLTTVKVSGFDYWYVYKRLNQAHESDTD